MAAGIYHIANSECVFTGVTAKIGRQAVIEQEGKRVWGRGDGKCWQQARGSHRVWCLYNREKKQNIPRTLFC